MTHKARILKILREAGEKGVSSKDFIAAFMPRAAARIQDLKDEGYEISSEREGKYCRWTLIPSSPRTDGNDISTCPRSSTEERRTSKPMVAGSSPAGGSQVQCGATRRSINERARSEANPITGGIARRPARSEMPGGRSEVPAAAPAQLSLASPTPYEHMEDAA